MPKTLPSILRFLIICCTFTIFVNIADAGTLRLGNPVVQGNTYVFPVNLSGGNSSVAALNFTLTYDPAVFRAVDASAGTQAQVTNKVITAHAPSEGNFNVVMVGFNQQTLDSGEVARLVLERIGDTDVANLAITKPTLAAWDGEALPSTGKGLELRFSGAEVTAEETESDASVDATTRQAKESEDTATSNTDTTETTLNISSLDNTGMSVSSILDRLTEGGKSGESPLPEPNNDDMENSDTTLNHNIIPTPSEQSTNTPVIRVISPSADSKVEAVVAESDETITGPSTIESPISNSRVENADTPLVIRNGEIQVEKATITRHRVLLLGGACIFVFAVVALMAMAKMLFH